MHWSMDPVPVPRWLLPWQTGATRRRLSLPLTLALTLTLAPKP